LDACEESGILPDVSVFIEKVGPGSLKNSDQVRIRVLDNGPGIDPEDIPKVFGEYLASSKFGKGRCSRGQQGIGISAATTWAQLTSATGARIITKTPTMRKAVRCSVEVDIRNNKGLVKDKDTLDWDRVSGTSVEFLVDGRIQLNGEAGLLNYLTATTLVNPHLTLRYKMPDIEEQTIERVTQEMPGIPEATEPHPHTMKLGEFIAHSHLFGRVKTEVWLKKGFSRVHEGVLNDLVAAGVPRSLLEKLVDSLGEAQFKQLFIALQNLKLMAPSTKSVLSIGEDGFAKSIKRLGAIDFFSVVSRKPAICDFKPVQVEVAVARLEDRVVEADASVQILRFANRVPLQFDKAACAIVHSIESVNWRAYGLAQSKNSIPQGPYIIAVSVVSPFIKFKNASKETIDASDELVEEIRRALIQAGQKLSKHLRREVKANELEEKMRHIEQFCPILIDALCRITEASAARRKKAEDGLVKILGRDALSTKKELDEAHAVLEAQNEAENETETKVGKKAVPNVEVKSQGKAGKKLDPKVKASAGKKVKSKKSPVEVS
jgi:DNA topoisomerase-6 subunit B